jgi:hypothetical protein
MTTLARIVPALVLVALGSHASAMVLCATRNGGVVADEQCRRREVRLEPRDLGIVGAAGPAGPAGLPGLPGAPVERSFRLVDANGVPACTPLASDGLHVLCVLEPRPASAPHQLVVHRDGTDADAPYVYYGAAGCRGPIYVQEPESIIPRATLFGDRLFVPTGPLFRLVALSAERVAEPCSTSDTRTPQGTCCTSFTSPVDVEAASAELVELSTLGLAAPLRVEGP